MTIPDECALTEALLYHAPKRWGYCVLWCEGKEHPFPLSELPNVLERLPRETDAYLSQAEFRRYNRRLVNLERIGLCFADLDTYKTANTTQYKISYANLPPEQQAAQLLMFCDEEGILRPSLITFSGRGLHVKWLYDHPIPAQALPRWNAVQRELGTRLKSFAVDKAALDASRILRLPGTVNSRTGKTVHLLHLTEHQGSPLRYDFETLCHELLPLTRAKLAAMKQVKAGAHRERGLAKGRYSWSSAHLWWLRLKDMESVFALRGWDTGGVPEGYRHNALYIAACAICWACSAQKREAEMREWAQTYCSTLPPSEVNPLLRWALQCTREPQKRHMTSERIIDILEISTEERRELKTLLLPDERACRRKEANRLRYRKPESLSLKERQREAKRKKARVHSLRTRGLFPAEIAEKLSIPLNTVRAYLREGA